MHGIIGDEFLYRWPWGCWLSRIVNYIAHEVPGFIAGRPEKLPQYCRRVDLVSLDRIVVRLRQYLQSAETKGINS